MTNYALLINTCDSFEDCWKPYFKLQAIYWPDCKARLYLNTETKDFSYPGIDIFPLKVAENENNRRLTWSECLLRALDKIDEDIVLYMQEDYFLKAPVKNNLLEKYVLLMLRDDSIHCIHLTDQGPYGECASRKSDTLRVIPRKHKDRICCQAALWRKNVLRQYIRRHESAWNFEWFGSKRASILNHNFFVVDRSVVYESVNRSLGARLQAKIKRFPLEVRSSLDLLSLKIQSALK
jgi:hypothetical protein